MNESSASNLVWIDTETTGLDPVVDRLLEIACVITNPDLEILEGEDFQIDIGTRTLADVIARCGERVQAMHWESGLFEALATGPVTGLVAAGDAIARMIDTNGCCGLVAGKPYRSPLCGSTPSFDRGFIRAKLPQIDSRLSYRHVDVSSIHELALRWYDPALVHGTDTPSEHRAMADILFSIERLKFYRRHVFSPHLRARSEILDV